MVTRKSAGDEGSFIRQVYFKRSYELNNGQIKGQIKRPTDDCEDGLFEGRLEQRSFARDFATKLSRGVEVDVLQQNLRLAGFILLKQRRKKKLFYSVDVSAIFCKDDEKGK